MKEKSVLLVWDCNAVEYHQQVKNQNSSNLFQYSNSRALLDGLTMGRNISISKSDKCFVSPYFSFGDANIGAPKLTLKGRGIVEQRITGLVSIYAKQSARIGYCTSSNALCRSGLSVG